MSIEQYTPPPPTVPPPSPEPAFPGSLPPAAADGAEELPGGGRRSLRSRVERLGPRSLTARIVSGVVILVFVVVAGAGTGTYFYLRRSLEDRLNQQVASAAVENSHYFNGFNCQPTAGTASLQCGSLSGPRQEDESVALLYPNGRLAGEITSGPFTALQLTAAQRRSLATHPDRVYSITSGSDELRATGHANNSGLVVVTALSTDDTDRTLGQLLGTELIIGLSAVVIAFVATAAGVRFSLRHLRQVTVTAQEVAAELSPTGAGLDRRVPDDDPGTEVGQLATSFNTMLSAVETQFAARLESEQRMRQFMADASHELRTPLTSIRGYAELARMQRAAGDTSDDNLDRIESEGTRMSRLVEDLLTLARGETDGSDRQVQRELIDVRGLLDDAASGSRAAFPGRRIDVQLAGEPLVLGDRDQLVRVVRNLVNNAAIHTAPDRPILVNGFGDVMGATIQVIDGGPGLAPDDAAHVFERFWRADKARTRARGGSGLGLSIVAAIVRAHGGTVRFDSTVETGSTVTFTLPAAQPASD